MCNSLFSKHFFNWEERNSNNKREKTEKENRDIADEFWSR
jgi:hypothetical protein